MTEPFPDRHDRLFGREADVARLTGRARLPGITAVIGRARMGKTWVAQELARRLVEAQVQVGYHEAKGGESHVLRAVSDLYARWLDDSDFVGQGRSLWERHKDGLIGKVGRAAKTLFEPLASLAPGVGGVIRVLEKLGAADEDLKSGGVTLAPLQYDQALAVTTLVADLTDRPLVLILDGWEHSATIAADRRVLEGMQASLSDWGRLHVFLFVRHPLDAQDGGPSEAMKAARALVDYAPASNALIELGGMVLDDAPERARLVARLHAEVGATRAVDDDAVLAMVDGYPGVLADWFGQNLATTMQREADLREHAADAQQNRYADLAGKLAAFAPDRLRFAARLAAFPRLDASSGRVWIALGSGDAGQDAQAVADDLVDAGVLVDAPVPTFGHDTRHVAARRWFQRERESLIRREAERAIARLACRITGIDEASLPVFELLVGCERDVLAVDSAGRQIVAAADNAFDRFDGMEAPAFDIWLRERDAGDGLAPLLSVALVRRAFRKNAAGDTPGALADFDTVTAMTDANAEALAKALLFRGASRAEHDAPAALVDYERVIAMQDAPVAERLSALLNRAIVRSDAGDPRALADLDAVLETGGARRKTVVDALVLRSQLRFDAGDVDGADADWARIVDLPEAPSREVRWAIGRHFAARATRPS